MRIYLFTISWPDEIAIVQVYARGRIKAKQSLLLIHGCEEKQVKYQGEDTTTEPMNWLSYQPG